MLPVKQVSDLMRIDLLCAVRPSIIRAHTKKQFAKKKVLGGKVASSQSCYGGWIC